MRNWTCILILENSLKKQEFKVKSFVDITSLLELK